jgi:hypothetical protein
MTPFQQAEIALKQAHEEHIELWELAFALVSSVLIAPQATKMTKEGWDAFTALNGELRRINPSAFDALASRIERHWLNPESEA